MRKVFSISLIIALIFSGSYFYLEAKSICEIPLKYRLGAVDERFNISSEEAKLAIADAASVWENVADRKLFIYDQTADFSINFIFDDRQALANAEGSLKERLDAAESLTDAMRATYDRLVEKYDKLEVEYKKSFQSYEKRLAEYNAEVAKHNANGGAPSEVFAELDKTRLSLDVEQADLNKRMNSLNDLVDEINQVGSRSNQLVDTYNRGVDTFNDTFGEGREFTQGDYQGDRINIYTFTDQVELRLVLAHELGHAISLDHVESPESVMHFLLGEQNGYELTDGDLEEFNSICGASTFERIKLLWSQAYHQKAQNQL